MINSPLVLLALSASLASAFRVNERIASLSNPLKRAEPVNSTVLQSKISLDGLLAHAQKLEDIAYATPERNRQFGGTGHNASVQYFYDTLTSLGDYYDVTVQPFSELAYTDGNYTLNVDGAKQNNVTLFSYSPNGNATEILVPVSNTGCEAADFPAEVSGKVALISRGTCEFGLKVALAGSAQAVAVIIHNNVDGEIAGTLGVPPRSEGPYVPTVGVDLATGTSYKEAIAGGATLTVNVVVDGSVTEERFTNNVIAETKGGDKSNVLYLGAHSDSVTAGPGINDNGSGSAALLEVAKQLAAYDVTNAVRFAWWSAEESGLLGSTYWVEHAAEEDLATIRLYLNFDMIASPNFVLAAYDGDGSAFNISGPPGSAEAEKLFQDYYDSVGSPWTSSEFSGRSDYGPFLDAGIACGGLDTGAEGLKTEEEAAKFGGEANVAYDINYHGAGDNVSNLALDAFEINSKAIAHAVAVYATSFDSLPPKAVASASKFASEEKPLRIYKGDTIIA